MGFSFNFLDSGFTLINKSRIIGSGALLDGLYYIELQNDVAYNSMHITVGVKRCVVGRGVEHFARTIPSSFD